MNLLDVMDALGEGLGAISDLRVVPFSATTINPPAGWVEWPDGESLVYDVTYLHGASEMTVPVRVAVGRVDARSSRAALAAYCNGSGLRSVKAAIEAHQTSAYDDARVASCSFGVIEVGAVPFLAVTFTVKIIGNGA